MQQDGSCGNITEKKKQAIGGKGDSTDCGGSRERAHIIWRHVRARTKSVHDKRTDAWQITDLLNSEGPPNGGGGVASISFLLEL